MTSSWRGTARVMHPAMATETQAEQQDGIKLATSIQRERDRVIAKTEIIEVHLVQPDPRQ
jgi:hypothetical protein